MNAGPSTSSPRRRAPRLGALTAFARQRSSLTALCAVCALVGAAGAVPSQAAQLPPAPQLVAAEPPDSAAGRQLRWFLDASTRLPLGDAELRAHFSKAFLGSPGQSPAQINASLRALADAGDFNWSA